MPEYPDTILAGTEISNTGNCGGVQMNYSEKARLVKEASLQLGASPTDVRCQALEAIADALTADKEKIFALVDVMRERITV